MHSLSIGITSAAVVEFKEVTLLTALCQSPQPATKTAQQQAAGTTSDGSGQMTHSNNCCHRLHEYKPMYSSSSSSGTRAAGLSGKLHNLIRGQEGPCRCCCRCSIACMHCAWHCKRPALTDCGAAPAGCHASSSTLADDAARALLLWLHKQLLIIMFTAGQMYKTDV
jgi:hypothetical protein